MQSMTSSNLVPLGKVEGVQCVPFRCTWQFGVGWLACRVLLPILGNGVPAYGTTFALVVGRAMLCHSTATAIAASLTATVVEIVASLTTTVAAAVVAIATFPAIVTRLGVPVAPTVAAPLLLCRAKNLKN